MSQRDKQWIINIQLNQLKCDNPYVDDYYYTMYQAKYVPSQCNNMNCTIVFADVRQRIMTRARLVVNYYLMRAWTTAPTSPHSSRTAWGSCRW